MIKTALLQDMIEKKIDVKAVLAILEDINSGKRGKDQIPQAVGVPTIDGKTIIPLGASFLVNKKKAKENLGELSIKIPDTAVEKGDDLFFSESALKNLGEELYPITSWGILNGGLATSYADIKKNETFIPGLFDILKPAFEQFAPLCEDKPKGLTPAYINPDGSPGASFILIKMRAALLKAETYVKRFGYAPRPILPMFQMTSNGTDDALTLAYEEYRNNPWISELIRITGSDPTRPKSAIQPLLAALSHSSKGYPKTIFDSAYGKENSSLALPGGHGQSFSVLSQVYRTMLREGYRYTYIGNVDNIAYNPDSRELAIMALTGAEAAFEFSYRTAFDTKGGVLIETDTGNRTIADIGMAISFDKIRELEARGEKILFNCATGLFDLRQLVSKLDYVASNLPLRISDQDKDPGRYGQAEQSTWEVVGLLEKPVGFAVKKSERFIAAKLLIETLLTSMTKGSKLPKEIEDTQTTLASGLSQVLAESCKLQLTNEGVWAI